MEINIEIIEKFLSMEKEYQYFLNCVKQSNKPRFKCIPSYHEYCVIRFKIAGYEVESDLSMLTIHTRK